MEMENGFKWQIRTPYLRVKKIIYFFVTIKKSNLPPTNIDFAP